MKNPWARKNPLLSMWLSGANAVAGSARGRAIAEGRRQMNRNASQVAGFWRALLTPPVPGAVKQRNKRKAR